MMNLHHYGEIKYLTFSNLDGDHRITHGIFQRHGGCSPAPWCSLNLSTTVGDSRENVIENRTRIMRALGFPEDDFFDVWQIHSAKVVVIDRPRPREQTYIQADAIITNTPGVVLLMRFADCVPVLLFDPVNCVIGLAHAGWMGTVQKIARVAVENMHDSFGTNPQEIQACIGPSISSEQYPVGLDVINKVKNAFPNDWQALVTLKNKQYHLDLWHSNEQTLREAGVANIIQSNICTASNDNDWFSHRAEKGKTGRFAILLAIK
jgi:hypothetical protein